MERQQEEDLYASLENPDEAIDVVEHDPHEPMLIKGTEGMSLNFAECCHPIPGDPIIGILTAGKGVSVHIDDCQRIAKLAQKKSCLPIL